MPSSGARAPAAGAAAPDAPAPATARLTPESFAYGMVLGEGAYSRVVHARRLYPNGRLGSSDYAVKIMEKRFIKRENKVRGVCAAAAVLVVGIPVVAWLVSRLVAAPSLPGRATHRGSVTAP